MSKFNKNGRNLKGGKLDSWVEATVPAEVSPPDTGPEPEPKPKPKPQGKKRKQKTRSK